METEEFHVEDVYEGDTFMTTCMLKHFLGMYGLRHVGVQRESSKLTMKNPQRCKILGFPTFSIFELKGWLLIKMDTSTTIRTQRTRHSPGGETIIFNYFQWLHHHHKTLSPLHPKLHPFPDFFILLRKMK